MNRIKTYLNSLGRATRTTILALAVVFVSAGIAQAATTISTNILTGGTLGVTGLSSLGSASSTQFSANTAYFGQTATSTFSSAGALTLAGALSGTSGTFSTTLGVTGLSSLAFASSTLFSANTAYFGQTATSTFGSAGQLTLLGALVGTSGTFSTTLGVTGATTLTASTTVGTATLFAGADLNRVGVGTTTPLDLFHVENQSATTTVIISTKAAAKGGRIILEDVTGTACTEVTAAAGVLSAKVVTCPTGI